MVQILIPLPPKKGSNSKFFTSVLSVLGVTIIISYCLLVYLVFFLFSAYFNGWKGNLKFIQCTFHSSCSLDPSIVITIEMIKAMRNENELNLLSLDQLVCHLL